MPAPGKVAFVSAAGNVSGALILWSGRWRRLRRIQFSPCHPSREAPASYSAPIELIHDKPYVSVMVNGRGPFRFLIDTGTGGQALVSPELADELALPVVGHARLMDPSGLGEQRSDILRVHSLKIAGVEFADIKAIRHRLYGEEENCQGVLGFTLFKDYLLTLDYPGRRLVLTSGVD